MDINKCMANKDINWGYWRTFLAILDTGSLSAAARHLSLTQPTAGRHIDNLERALAAPLFIRSQEGLMPTSLALALKPKAQAMSMSAHALKRLVKTEGGLLELQRVKSLELKSYHLFYISFRTNTLMSIWNSF